MKRTTKKAVSILAASALLALTLAGCGNDTTTTDTASDTTEDTSASTLSGAVATNGSTSMEEVMGVLTEHPDVSVTYDPTGSGTGIEAAANGTADIGLSSRALTEEETASGLVGTEVALDGIAVIVNAENPVSDLTLEQIASIYTGAVTDWSEFGSDAGAIAVIGRESGSGTRDGFESITGNEDQ